MAKKDLNGDIFSGGSISDGDKSAKGAKKAEKLAKKAEKNAAKKARLESEIKTLKNQLSSQTDEKSKAILEKKLAKAKNSLAVLNGKKTGIASDKIRVIQSVVAVVIVIGLLVAYVATGTVRKGFIHSTLQWTTGITAATVENKDGEKIRIPVSTYNYYFATTYNTLVSTKSAYEQYGLDPADYNLDVDFDKALSKQTTTNSDDEVVTWLEYVNDQVLESIQNTYMYYTEAVKANGGEEPEITDEQQAEIDDAVSNYKSTAANYGYTVSGYLVQAMGKGVTEKVFRRESKISYIAQNYSSELSETASAKEYTEDDYNSYKNEHTDELQSVSIKIFEANSEDTAKEFRDALNSNGSNFTDLCVEYSETDSDKNYYAQDEASTKLNATKQILQNNGYAIATAEHNHEEGEEHSEDEELEYPGLDWLFSADRRAGDIYQYSTSVVYVISPAELSEEKTVNVRHILIAPETDNSDSQASAATDEQWAAALEKAQEVLDEYNSGDRTEESFTALVSTYSTDTGSVQNGGLYENVRPGQMVDAFESWAFAPNRNSGDVSIVRTNYGYHIMYFVEKTDMPVWKAIAQNNMALDDSTTAAEALQDSYSSSMNWFGKFYVEKDTDIDS